MLWVECKKWGFKMPPHKFIVTMKKTIPTPSEIDAEKIAPKEYTFISDEIQRMVNNRFGTTYKISVTKEQPKRYRRKLPKANIG